MKLLSTLACALPLAWATGLTTLAQTTPAAGVTVYTYAEQMPMMPAEGTVPGAAIAVAVKQLTTYPAAAIRARVEGRVFVSFVVTAQGQVQDERIVKGVRPDLDSAVLAAVRKLPRLLPGRQGGQAVAVQLTAPVTFRLPPPSPALPPTSAPDLTLTNPTGEKVLGKIYTYVEQMPQLPGGGGNAAIVAAIERETKYPPEALRRRLEGRVFVSFTVGRQGEVYDAKIVKGIGGGCDEAVLAAVRRLPRLKPGTQGGEPVVVSFTVPVTFKLSTAPAPSPGGWPARPAGQR